MSNIYKEEIDKKELYLPLSIDEYISENNQVRAVEDFPSFHSSSCGMPIGVATHHNLSTSNKPLIPS